MTKKTSTNSATNGATKKKTSKKTTSKRTATAGKTITGLPKDRYTGDAVVPANDPLSTRRLEIPAVHYSWARLVLVSQDESIILNCFREEQKTAMERKQMGLPRPKANRNPRREYRESTHICKGGYSKELFDTSLFGYPAVGLKKSIATAAYRYGGVKDIVSTCAIIFINGPYGGLIPLWDQRTARRGNSKDDIVYEGAKPLPRRDTVTLQGGKPTTSLAYRAEFYPWCMEVDIRYWDQQITLESVVNAFSLAGSFVGIGSWRLEKKGNHGGFAVESVIALPDDYVAPVFHDNKPESQLVLPGE